jgi:hypothetical protein
VDVEPADRAGPAVIWRDDAGGTFLVPGRLRVRLTAEPAFDVELEVTVDGDGTPRCTALALRSRVGGAYVDPGALRSIGLNGWMREAVRMASTPVEVQEIDDRTVITLERTDVFGERTAPSQRARSPRRNDPPEEDVRRAAELYEQAKAEGRPKALEWVAEQLGLTRSTAYNWVRRGRELAGG